MERIGEESGGRWSNDRDGLSAHESRCTAVKRETSWKMQWKQGDDTDNETELVITEIRIGEPWRRRLEDRIANHSFDRIHCNKTFEP